MNRVDDENEQKKKILEAEEFYQKGLFYGNESDADGAIECWRKALGIKPGKYETWYNLGIT